ncbi:unnamed protein product [Polarella glacialis]|uniref:Uncharacterized protein n=1 Tax=Polarella glacialis TaxID=89957 RepID=A0A813FB69_POLGL|nr:unnamed protein product [Polarella glacialis]
MVFPFLLQVLLHVAATGDKVSADSATAVAASTCTSDSGDATAAAALQNAAVSAASLEERCKRSAFCFTVVVSPRQQQLRRQQARQLQAAELPQTAVPPRPPPVLRALAAALRALDVEAPLKNGLPDDLLAMAWEEPISGSEPGGRCIRFGDLQRWLQNFDLSCAPGVVDPRIRQRLRVRLEAEGFDGVFLAGDPTDSARAALAVAEACLLEMQREAGFLQRRSKAFGSPFGSEPKVSVPVLRQSVQFTRGSLEVSSEQDVVLRGVAAAAHRPGTSLLFVGYREAFCGQTMKKRGWTCSGQRQLLGFASAEALPLRGSATKLAAPRRDVTADLPHKLDSPHKLVPQLLSAMLFFKWFASVPDMSALQCKACVSRRSSSRGHRRVSISVLLWVELPELAFEDSSSQAERRPTQRTRRALRGLARWLLVPEGRHLVLLVEGGDRREAEAVTAVLVKRGVAPERLPFRLQDGPVQLSVSGESLPVQVGCSAAR